MNSPPMAEPPTGRRNGRPNCPNKRLEDVIKAFTLYQRHRAPAASLVIVGSDVGFERYGHALVGLVAQIGAENVVFTGAVSSEARDAWYARADAYISMSVHEGFCAPLIEALAHGVRSSLAERARCPRRWAAPESSSKERTCRSSRRRCTSSPSSASTRSALYDAADRRLAELRPEALVPRIRSALGPCSTATSLRDLK